MSWEALKWALDIVIEKAPAKAVLVCLANCHNNKTGECFPGINHITKMTGFERRSVWAGIEELVHLNLIEIKKTNGKSNKYKLNINNKGEKKNAKVLQFKKKNKNDK